MGSTSLSFRPLCSFHLILVLVVSIFLTLLPRPAFSQCKIPPVIFNFGDSNSDTGGLVAGLGFPVRPPYGRIFFRRPTGRLSDGRLVIDFLCFRNLIDNEGFRNALYMIDIGQNDIAASFSKNLSYVQVIKRIPSVILEIKAAMKVIYDQGGRKFWVHNTGPLGCLPQKLSMAPSSSIDRDPYGCLLHYNDAAKAFNEELRHLCQELLSEMKDATIVYVDIYAIKYDLIANSSKYGFSSPLMACCGFGGPAHNYNINFPCSTQTGNQVCSIGGKYISWDGIHYTEAANSFIASKILSRAYSTPPMPFNFFCIG